MLQSAMFDFKLVVLLFLPFAISSKMCNDEGGIQVEDRCICNPGYSGRFCDTYLYIDIESDIELKVNSKSPVDVADNIELLQRLRRQATSPVNETEEGTGSGKEDSGDNQPEEPCEPGQGRANETAPCVDVVTFKIELNINASQVLEGSINKEIQQQVIEALRNASLLPMLFHVEAMNMSSNHVEGVVVFQASRNLTTDLLASSLEAELKKQNLIIAFKVADFDECQKHDCGSNRECKNTDGSFHCECLHGYVIDTTKSQTSRNLNCQYVCANITCSNFGLCTVDPDNQPVCMCKDGYYGPKCESNFLSWKQATIALGVTTAVLLLCFVIVAIVLIHRKKKTKTTADLPLVTGFIASDKGDKGVNAAFDAKAKKAHNDNGEAATGTTTTFKPAEVEDDSL